jgi:uncharacterized Ntn-hydrolase superfamily protein
VTYSIIGRDPESGEVGIAVQSRWFHAGQDLAWIEPGVGAVCTQAMIEPAYGLNGLELMRAGRSAAEALAGLTAADVAREVRQVAMADAEGRFAQHTGSSCVPACGHTTGHDCCAQGNMLASESCWGAMVAAFEATDGELTDRLLAALDAAEREGGDARGRQAAGILVRPAAPSGTPWQDRVVELLVVDDPDPVAELRRLVALKRAYDRLGVAFDLVARGELGAAADEVVAAQALAPDDDQIAFWRAIMLGAAGRGGDAAAAWEAAVRAHPGWPEFLRRAIAAGLVPPEAAAVADAGAWRRRPRN